MKFTLFIPTKNEIDGVKAIMPRIKKEWVDEIIVVDGHSTDGTFEYFKEHGFNVIIQTLPGGAGAWWEGFQAATGDIIIPFSPDGNSIPEKIPELVKKIRESQGKENYDMVIVSRYKGGAESYDDDWLSALANFSFNKIVNFLFGASYTDCLVMYKAFKKELLKELNFNQNTGMEFNKYKAPMFELLISIRCAKKKKKVAEISGDEPDRVGGKKESRAHPGKLAKAYDGLLMLYYIIKEFVLWPFEK